MSTRNKEIVEKVNASFAANNLEGFLAQCADDVEWTMVGEKICKGKAAIRDWIKAMPAEPPVFTVATLIGEGDLVMAQGDMTMNEKERKAVPYSYCDIYRFRGDKIVELKSFVIKTEAAATA
jgi:ketosteroid isomerase-like protein